MGKAIKLKEGQIFNAWKVIEPNIINPNTNGINKNKSTKSMAKIRRIRGEKPEYLYKTTCNIQIVI